MKWSSPRVDRNPERRQPGPAPVESDRPDADPSAWSVPEEESPMEFARTCSVGAVVALVGVAAGHAVAARSTLGF